MDLFNHEKTQRAIEKTVMILYTIYTLGIFSWTMQIDCKIWISLSILVCAFLAWVIFFAEFFSYSIRVRIESMLTHLAFLLFAFQVKEIYLTLPVLIVLTLFMGLYGVMEVMVIPVISTSLLLGYHGIIDHVISLSTEQDIFFFFLMSLNVYISIYIIYFWVKKRNVNQLALFRTINVLKNAEQSKDDFLANVSHEIRTPINTICGMSEILMKEEDPQKIKDEIFKIHMAGRSLMSVVGDILDFSELQSGKVEMEEEAYDITTTINEILTRALAKKNEKNIEVIVDCDADIPRKLFGDEKKIRRVIMNIVDNAIKFTNDGGVCISLHARKESYGINLDITVRDTGIGMKQESLEKLFTSFSQIDSKRNRQEGGVGLGLAISKAICEKMGGVITIKSKYGKGTEVKVVFPQKVLDETPIAIIEGKEKLNIATYIDMEQFEMTAVRDEYANVIRSIVEKVQVKCHVCRNMAELKRRHEYENFTHIFISMEEYREDRVYFDELSKNISIILIIDQDDEKELDNDRIHYIYKPFYVVPIVSAINGVKDVRKEEQIAVAGKFIAPSAKILVVDDNVMNLEVIQGLLKDYEIQVDVVTSGVEALDMIESMDYDFIFMDHMMPVMDGIETLHQIRKKIGTYYQEVPVIVLTANAIAGTREMFMREGFCDFVEKPIEIPVLERVLLRHIPKEKIETKEEKNRKVVQDNGNAKADIVKTSDMKEEVISSPAKNEGLVVGDLDVETGLRYCGGEERYISVLKRYAQQGREEIQRVDALYKNEDWQNYCISVHGIKSAMLSIGALPLSDMGKALEAASKEGNIEFIHENHNRLIEEYTRVIHILEIHPVCGVKKEPATSDEMKKKEYEVLSKEAFEKILEEMDEAMLDLDGTRMLEMLEDLKKYQYFGTPLEGCLDSIQKKVEMSDYMSAVDELIKIFHKLSEKVEGGE